MADIGATLREARMRAKIDINEVERRTKIRAKYLRAIENEEWDLLPGEVYVKSFLRTYGDFLGLDSRQLMDDYKRRYERPSDYELRPITPRGRERERDRGPGRPRIPPWAVIGLVLVGVVVALYFVGRNPSTPTPPTTHANKTLHRHHHTGAGTHTTAKAKLPPTKVKLQLVATGQVYVCLVDGAGKPLIPGLIFSPGQTIPTKTSSKLLLTLGNASVKMTVNGRPVAVAPSSSAIGFLLTPTSHSTLPPSRQPRCA
jgi:transcriptional regulator with XRE-family HTH domain